MEFHSEIYAFALTLFTTFRVRILIQNPGSKWISGAGDTWMDWCEVEGRNALR